MRGLKLVRYGQVTSEMMSHPVRGAWIEIYKLSNMSLAKFMSHPVRGAWIEIKPVLMKCGACEVASRKGCVD